MEAVQRSNKISHQIKTVAEGSLAEMAGLVAGDIITHLNGVELIDIFDYHFYSDGDEVVVTYIRDGQECTTTLSNPDAMDLGIIFENGLMDNYHSCSNKCVFCFIDQNPKGMRETIYFKDDDTRLSFLQGNYVTLTNIKDEDIKRIISYNLAPINISVHTTNPELRCKMLNNRFAGDIMRKIKMFADAGVPMNSQIVCCPELNDGAELERTIEDMLSFYPAMESLSVVPVGLTKYREGLYPLRLFTKEESVATLDIIEKWQNIAYEKYGVHFVHPSDEWYFAADREIPEADRYDGFGQLENGVGVSRLLYDEVVDAISRIKAPLFMKKRTVSIVSGTLCPEFSRSIYDKIEERYPKVKINLYPIVNHFFGETITVSGLVTGGDIIEQLKDKDLGDVLLIPACMTRVDEPIFLDDVTVAELEESLHIKATIVKFSGEDLVNAVLGRE